jgi:hypothetical protein
MIASLAVTASASDIEEKTLTDETVGQSIAVAFNVERPSDHDILVLKSGDRLTGTILNESFTLTTGYGTIKFMNRHVAAIGLDTGTSHIESIMTVNNNRFSGFIEEPAFVFKLQKGPQVDVRREKVLKAVFRIRDGEVKGVPQRHFMRLRNGDFFTGSVLNDELAIATPFAKVPVELSNVESLTFLGGTKSLAEVLFKNGGVLQGVLESEDIHVELDMGPTISVYQDRFDVIYGTEGFVPDTTAPVDVEPVIRLGGKDKIGYGAEFADKRLKIVKIAEGSPAAKAGLREGDQIFSVDGQELAADNAIRKVRDDILKGKREEATVGVQRGEQTIMFRLVK